jgi:hypothetical protein
LVLTCQHFIDILSQNISPLYLKPLFLSSHFVGINVCLKCFLQNFRAFAHPVSWSNPFLRRETSSGWFCYFQCYEKDVNGGWYLKLNWMFHHDVSLIFSTSQESVLCQRLKFQSVFKIFASMSGQCLNLRPLSYYCDKCNSLILLLLWLHGLFSLALASLLCNRCSV